MHSSDPKNLFSALHSGAVGEITQLMSGLYSNIEDSLFELAFSHGSDVDKRHIGDLMKELRFRRESLLKTFGKRVHSSARCWLGDTPQGPELMEQRILAKDLAKKCHAHFGHLLQDLSERAEHATGYGLDKEMLPLSPEQLSYHFLMSCRTVKFEKYSIDVVKDLFARFVLDRLGGVYGAINAALSDAGYATTQQRQSTVSNRA